MHARKRLLPALGAIAPTVILSMVLVACEDEVTGLEDDFVEGEITLDASNPATFSYLSFADGGSVVTVTDAQSSTEWDIAFRRFSVKLNGGVAGPGDVAGSNLGNNAGLASNEVTGLVPADADAAFEAVTEADIAGAVFAVDGLEEDLSGPWFRFDPISGTLVANTGAAWKVRESSGGFALFRIGTLDMMGQAPLGVTIEYRHQDAGGTLGALSTVDVDFAQGPGFVDLAAGAVVQPSGCDWDVSVAPSFMIEFNDACDAGTFPLDATEDFNGLSQADDAPDYGGFLSVISGAIPSTVEDAAGVFWYNIEGNNRLWPTYNVFLVRVGTAIYKVQVTDYYDATGASGFPTVRFQRLQ